MGHGASTNVKKLTISQGINSVPRKSNEQAGTVEKHRPSSPAKLGWTRSNSDGCIVENLNTSKTKADLLELQVDEYKELFKHAEQKAEKAEARTNLLEQQMAEVEGTNFDLLDRVSELEQQLEELKDQTSPEAEMEYSDTLTNQNQTIEKQEQQIKSLEEDLAKMRVKLKKKLRSVQTELAEARQEAGLKMYSLKDEIGKLREENAKLVECLDRAHSISSAQSRQSSAATTNSRITKEMPKEDAESVEMEWEDSRTKVILELSSQLNAQDQRICELEEVIKEKDRMISGLQQRGNARPPSGSQRKQISSRSMSAGKRIDSSQVDSCDGEDDQRRSSSASSKVREGHRSSSGGRRTSSGKHRQVADDLTNNCDDGGDDIVTNHRTRTVGSTSSSKVRQLSANSVDSAISDHSDSGSRKVSSVGSSRQRRRLKNQMSRQSSPEEREAEIGSSKVHPDARIEGRDSGIGVAVDVKSKYSDELDQTIVHTIGNS